MFTINPIVPPQGISASLKDLKKKEKENKEKTEKQVEKFEDMLKDSIKNINSQ